MKDATTKPVGDTPSSHLHNALASLRLMRENLGAGVVVGADDLLCVERRIAAALVNIDMPQTERDAVRREMQERVQ